MEMTNNTENNYTETDLGNISLNPRGEYDPSAVYEYLDTVSYQGGSYFCLAELETTITGIAPDPGHNSEHWQMIALPGGMTQEYITAHDDVINKANQVETSRVAVELAQQEVEAAQTDMQQLHSDTVQAAQEAENSKDSAANYAQSAEQSRNAASESEQNVNAQITKVETDVKKVANDRLAVEAAAKNVSDNTQSVVSNAKNAKTAAENAAQSAKSVEDASKQIEQNKKDVDSLKWGLSTKITKFYKSNQGETHITDSDNGKIMDMMLYGKSSQDGTPTPENPVEIKSVVNPTIKVCGKNLLQPNLRYSDEIKINLKKGLTLTMISKNGTNAKGGNLMFTLVDGEQYWLGFDTGSEKHQITLIKDSISATYYFTEESSENYALYIGDESAYEPYKEQSIQLPITLNAIPVHSGGNVTIDGQQYIADYVDVERGKVVRRVDSSKLDNTQSIIDKNEWLLAEPQEIDLTQEEVQTLKTLATYYPTTNISINSEQLDGYTVFNYPTPFEDEWNKTQKEIGGLKAETGSLKENLDNMHEDLYVKTYNIFDVNFLPRAFISLASSHAGELFLDNNDNYSATNETINVLPNTQYTFSNGSESIPYELQLLF